MTEGSEKKGARDQSPIWQSGAPPGPQNVAAGQRWTYRLPVARSDNPPRCHWSSGLFRDGRYEISGDTLTVTVEIPADARGIRKMNFKLDTSPETKGFVLVKLISPENEPAETPAPPKAEIPAPPKDEDPAEATTQPLPGAPAPVGEQRPGLGQPDSSPRSSCPFDAETQSKSAPIPIRDAPPQPPQPPSPSDPGKLPPQGPEQTPPPLVPGRYFVSVYRDRVPVLQLKKEIETHKSLVVGKFSRSKNIRPDLDLKLHFQNEELARQCSRSQARIYWSKGRVAVRNLGRNDMVLSAGGTLKTGDRHWWAPGEPVGLPGGLTMILEKEE